MTRRSYWSAARAQREADLLATGVPNPRRITAALDANALDGPEVDIACGGQEPMVDEWEAGTRQPTPDQVRLLADLTGFTVEFFYLPGPPPLTGFICQRTGRGRGCSRIDTRPAADVSRETSVTQLHPDTLF